MSEMSLNLGSGDKPMKSLNGHECVNVDIRDMSGHEKYEGAIFIQCDVGRLPFNDNSFVAILASDIIEHFPKTETKNVIKEWSRVLKIGGLMMFRTPDLRWMAKTYLQSEDAEFVSYHIFGGQGYKENFHYVIFDRKWLTDICSEFGLVVTDYKENHSNFELTCEKV